MIVLDASALLEVLLRTPPGLSLEPRLFQAGEALHAPHLIDLEVVQVLRRYWLRQEISPGRAAEAIDDLVDFPLIRYPHEPFIERIWELRGTLTAYDAAYIALAEALNAPLVTFDSRLASAGGHRARIRLAGDAEDVS